MLLAPLLFAAGETRPEGVAPQPVCCGHELSRGNADWTVAGGGGWGAEGVPEMEGDLLAQPGRCRAGGDNKQK